MGEMTVAELFEKYQEFSAKQAVWWDSVMVKASMPEDREILAQLLGYAEAMMLVDRFFTELGYKPDPDKFPDLECLTNVK